MADYFSKKHRPSLFRSQAWLKAWRMTWGECSTIRLIEPSESLRLSIVVYGYTQFIKKVIPIKTAFPLGVSTPVAPSLRSEYFTLFDDKSNDQSVLEGYVEHISGLSWSQFYIPDLLVDSLEWHGFRAAAQQKKWGFIVRDVSQVYGVDLSGGTFSDYVKLLGANTRLKLFNRRKNLSELGTVEIKNVWPNKTQFFNLINEFHNVRWGKPCYQGKNAEFISVLLDQLALDGHAIDLSVMSLDDQPISVALDISVNGRTYNLQSGYREQFAKNISLGTLHLGYQIEKAFLADDIDFYDFMAGTGKNANYKAALANKTADFHTILLVRNPAVKLLYSLQKFFR